MHEGSKRRRYVPSPAMVVACIALVVALTGTSYAITVLPRGSVGTPQLKRGAVVSAKVKDHSLLRRDFKAGQVPAGPPGTPGAPGSARAYAHIWYDGACRVTVARSKNVSGCTVSGTTYTVTTTVDISDSWPLCVLGSNGGVPTRPQTCITRPTGPTTFEVAMYIYPLLDTDADGEVNMYGSPFSHIGGSTTGVFVMVP
jgi:hypothetical protein